MVEVNIETAINPIDSRYDINFIGQLSDTEKRFASALFNSYLNRVGSVEGPKEFTISGFLLEARYDFENMSEAERLGFDSFDAAMKEIHDEQKNNKRGLV